MIRVTHRIPRDEAALGIVRAEGVQVAHAPDGFEALLADLLDARRRPLAAAEEAVRQAARDLLRNGRYKPTGRGKPASEYLVRAAQRAADPATDAGFPRINGPVDVCNYISLKVLLPISLWDLDLAATDRFVFRLGEAGEAYVFNTGGQTIELADLVVGCAVRGAAEEPIVNPVKDSLLTKTTDATRRVAACVYAPLTHVPAAQLEAVCETFAALLARCGTDVEAAYGVLRPGEEAHV